MNESTPAQAESGAEKKKAPVKAGADAAKADSDPQEKAGGKKYQITVHRKNPDDPPYVDVQVNGTGATRIRVGEKVTVNEAVMEVLRNAEETTYRFYTEGGFDKGADEQTAPLYPITVHQVIEA